MEPSVRIVEVVAAATDRDPTELPPLGAAVDADALNALVVESAAPVSTRFEYADRTVEIGDGELRLLD